MHVNTSVEDRALQDAIRTIYARANATSTHRRGAATDRTTRATFAALGDLGANALVLEGSSDVAHRGYAEAGIVAEELGRALAPEPWIETVLHAGTLLRELETARPERDVLISSIAGGRLVPGLAEVDALESAPTEATWSAGAWSLRGVKAPVAVAPELGTIVVAARTPGGTTGIFQVDPALDGIEVLRYRSFDTSTVCRITFEDAPAVPLTADGFDATPALARARAITRIALAREAVGIMDAALQRTTEYLRTRHQFGVPLSSFQALTFRAADMYVEVELSRSVVLWATMIADEEPTQVLDAAARAAAVATRACRHLSKEIVQMHGGLGITAEHPIAHHASRLLALGTLLGRREEHLDQLARSLTLYDTVELLT